eukprot:8377516-Pyramimonas_sp.AAC.1
MSPLPPRRDHTSPGQKIHCWPGARVYAPGVSGGGPRNGAQAEGAGGSRRIGFGIAPILARHT